MTIQIGDSIPEITLRFMGEDGPQTISTTELFKGKKVVLFAVPGAFTPTCSAAHLPGFVVNADKITSAGVDQIACISVNDAFVMDAWGKAQNAENILMLADGSAEFTNAIGMEKDVVAGGMGIRSMRYAMIANDGVVEYLVVDQQGLDVSSAEKVLAALESATASA